MQLLGAREFIKMPAGTFYIEFWKNTERECEQIISDFKYNPIEFTKELYQIDIFIDNYGAVWLIQDYEEPHAKYQIYDTNVVGDASPETTLYLVLSEEELPDKILATDRFHHDYTIKKEEVIKIKNKIVSEVDAEIDKWAIDRLDEIAKKGNKIVDTKIIL